MIPSSQIKDNTLTTLLHLMSSPFNFYPTGSRLWGTQKVGSDFDFYCGPESEEEVKGLQFFLLHTDGLDCNTLNIYRQGKVDVAILKNPLHRQQVEEHLRKEPIYQGLLKQATTTSAQKLVWNRFYQMWPFTEKE